MIHKYSIKYTMENFPFHCRMTVGKKQQKRQPCQEIKAKRKGYICSIILFDVMRCVGDMM